MQKLNVRKTTCVLAFTLNDSKDDKDRQKVEKILASQSFGGKRVHDMQTMWVIESERFSSAEDLWKQLEKVLRRLRRMTRGCSLDFWIVDITGRSPLETGKKF